MTEEKEKNYSKWAGALNDVLQETVLMIRDRSEDEASATGSRWAVPYKDTPAEAIEILVQLNIVDKYNGRDGERVALTQLGENIARYCTC